MLANTAKPLMTFLALLHAGLASRCQLGILVLRAVAAQGEASERRQLAGNCTQQATAAAAGTGEALACDEGCCPAVAASRISAHAGVRGGAHHCSGLGAGLLAAPTAHAD